MNLNIPTQEKKIKNTSFQLFNYINNFKYCNLCNNKLNKLSYRCISCYLNSDKYRNHYSLISWKKKKEYLNNLLKNLDHLLQINDSSIPLKCHCNKETILKDNHYQCIDHFCNYKKKKFHSITAIQFLKSKIQHLDLNFHEPKLHFIFSISQKKAMIQIYKNICAFFENRNIKDQYQNLYRLDGYAGTGKSTIIQYLFTLPEFNKYTICSCATTHAAVEVNKNIYHKYLLNTLQSKNLIYIHELKEMEHIQNLIHHKIIDHQIYDYILKDNHYETLSSLLNERPKYNPDGSITFNHNTLSAVKHEDKKNKSLYKINKYDILIIDEYSMITQDKAQWFKTFSPYLNSFILFAGDNEQIPPHSTTNNHISLDTQILNIPMINSELIEIHRTKNDVTKLANLIRQSKSIENIRNIITKFIHSNDILIIRDPLNQYSSILESFHQWKNEKDYSKSPPKLIAYTNQKVQNMNNIMRKKLNHESLFTINDYLILYKPIKIYGLICDSKNKNDDNCKESDPHYPIYLNINSIVKLANYPKKSNLSDLYNKYSFNWNDIIHYAILKLNDNLNNIEIELKEKINYTKSNISLPIIIHSTNIYSIHELLDIRTNEPKIFNNIVYLKNKYIETQQILNYIKNVLNQTEDYYIYHPDYPSLCDKFITLKKIMDKFIQKVENNHYKYWYVEIDGGSNIKAKLREDDIRNIDPEKKNIPFHINIISDSKEIANLCLMKEKMKSINKEIQEAILKKFKKHKIVKQSFSFIQEIIWENLYELFDKTLIFSNTDKRLQKYYKLNSDIYISYPYSSTIHKSQGQTFSDTYIDVTNIFKTNQNFIIMKRLLYTAITRCSGKLILNII